MESDIAKLLKQTNNEYHPRDMLLDFLMILQYSAKPKNRPELISAIRQNNMGQKLGYLFDITATIPGFEYLKSMAERLYNSPSETISLTPLSPERRRYNQLLKPDQYRTRWAIEEHYSAEEIKGLIQLYGITGEDRKRRTA